MPAPNRLDQLLVKKAAHAIIQKHNQDAASSSNLFDDEGNTLMVQLQLSKPFTKESYKPVRVKIPHSLYGNNTGMEYSICYFCVTNYKEEIEAYVRDHPIEGLNRILSMKDVQKFYKTYNDMKKLLREFTHFVVDAAIVRQLYNFLGPVFGAKHRMPVQIHCTKPADLPAEIEKVLQSSYIHLGGDNISMKIGHTKQTALQVAENVIYGVDFLAGKIPNSWSNIMSINLRLAQSAAIPVYSKKENELVEFLQSQVKKQQSKASSNSNSTSSSSKATESQKTPAKQQKQSQPPVTPAAAPQTAATASKTPKTAKKDKDVSPPVPPTTPATATAAAATSAKKSALKKKPEVAELPEPPKSAKKQAASKKDQDETVAVPAKAAATKAGARPTGIPKVAATANKKK